MIEVEKKFYLHAGDEQRLLEGAEKVSVKSMTDTYFDLPDYTLTKKDWWLRCRNDRWELKVALAGRSAAGGTNQYDELEDEQIIREAINLGSGQELSADLERAGYRPFATIITTRRKYRKQGFTIDLDSMDFGYEICEIEKMVDVQDEADQAVKQILTFAKEMGLEEGKTRGKVLEYLFRYAPEHYKALKTAWGGIV